MNLHVAPLTSQVWNDYCTMWTGRGGQVPGKARQGIYVQTDDGVLVGGIQCFPTDGEWLFVEHLAVSAAISPKVQQAVVRFMIEVCKGHATVLAKRVIILNGVAWCGALLQSAGFVSQALTPFIFAPEPLPLRPATADPQVAVLKAELAKAKEQLLGNARGLEEGMAEAKQKADAQERRERYELAQGWRRPQPVVDAGAVVEAGKKVFEEIIDDPEAGPESFDGVDNEVASAKALGMTVEGYREMVGMAQASVAGQQQGGPSAQVKKPRTPKQLAADERMRGKKK